MPVLYLGLESPDPSYVHLPLIEIVPHEWTMPEGPFSHIVLTSKQAVRLFFEKGDPGGQLVAIGPGTASMCPREPLVACEHTQEGVIELLKGEGLGRVLYPRSDLARPFLANWLGDRGVVIDLYTTRSRRVELPDLEGFEKVVFTSSSCVRAFFEQYDGPYLEGKFEPIGPITKKILLQFKSQ